MLASARLLFGFAVLVSPWLFGGAETHLIGWFVWPLAASLALATAAWSTAGHQAPLRVPLVALPLLAGVLLGALQLAPVFGEGGFPSHAAELRQQLSLDSDASPVALTVDPASTRRQIAWLLLSAAVVVFAANLFESSRERRWLLGAVAINGALLVAYSLFQAATTPNKVYGYLPKLSGWTDPVGPFVYHNQAGVYFATCGAALLGWAMLGRGGEVSGWRSPRDLQLQIAQAVIGALLLGGLIFSFSRGALLASVVAALAGVILLRRKIRARLAAPAAGVVIVAVLAFLLWASADSYTAERLASLGSERTFTEDGRVDIWRVATHAAGEFWGLGAGLGAYRQVHPVFDNQALELRIDHAHNQYLESIVEGGWPALALVLIALALVAGATRRSAKSSDRTVAALGAAGFAALVLQALHSLVDFCLYLPANLLLFATLAGVACGARTRALPNAATSRALVVGLALAGLYAAWVLQAHAGVDRAMQALPWRTDDSRYAAADADRWVAGLTAATEACPDDGQAWQALGEALVLRYRLQARDALAKELGAEADNPKLWEVTKPSKLLNAAAAFRRQGDEASLLELRTQETVAANLPEALGAFRSAVERCPLLASAHLRLLELSWLEGDELAVRRSVDRVMRLAPSDGKRLFEAGALAYLAGYPAKAWPAWRRCLELRPEYGRQVVNLAAIYLSPQELIERLLPDDPDTLHQVYVDSYADSLPPGLGKRILDRGIELLNSAAADRTPEQNRLLGQLHAAAGNPPAAIAAYAEAVRVRPTQAQWRYEFAMQLTQADRLEEALEQAVICNRMAPSKRLYQNLLDRLQRQTGRKRGPRE